MAFGTFVFLHQVTGKTTSSFHQQLHSFAINHALPLTSVGLLTALTLGASRDDGWDFCHAKPFRPENPRSVLQRWHRLPKWHAFSQLPPSTAQQTPSALMGNTLSMATPATSFPFSINMASSSAVLPGNTGNTHDTFYHRVACLRLLLSRVYIVSDGGVPNLTILPIHPQARDAT